MKNSLWVIPGLAPTYQQTQQVLFSFFCSQNLSHLGLLSVHWIHKALSSQGLCLVFFPCLEALPSILKMAFSFSDFKPWLTCVNWREFGNFSHLSQVPWEQSDSWELQKCFSEGVSSEEEGGGKQGCGISTLPSLSLVWRGALKHELHPFNQSHLEVRSQSCLSSVNQLLATDCLRSSWVSWAWMLNFSGHRKKSYEPLAAKMHSS